MQGLVDPQTASVAEGWEARLSIRSEERVVTACLLKLMRVTTQVAVSLAVSGFTPTSLGIAGKNDGTGWGG